MLRVKILFCLSRKDSHRVVQSIHVDVLFNVLDRLGSLLHKNSILEVFGIDFPKKGLTVSGNAHMLRVVGGATENQYFYL